MKNNLIVLKEDRSFEEEIDDEMDEDDEQLPRGCRYLTKENGEPLTFGDLLVEDDKYKRKYPHGLPR